MEGSGFRVQGSGFRVQGSGSRVEGAGFRVQGSGFRGAPRAHGRSEREGARLLEGLIECLVCGPRSPTHSLKPEPSERSLDPSRAGKHSSFVELSQYHES